MDGREALEHDLIHPWDVAEYFGVPRRWSAFMGLATGRPALWRFGPPIGLNTPGLVAHSSDQSLWRRPCRSITHFTRLKLHDR